MEPLPGLKIARLEDYDSYSPSLKGFTPPPQTSDLANSSVADLLKDLAYLQPRGEIVACFVPEEPQDPGLVLDNQPIPSPLGAAEISLIQAKSIQGQDEGLGDTAIVETDKIAFSNPAWSSYVDAGIKASLNPMTRRKNYTYVLVNMSLVTPGVQVLNCRLNMTFPSRRADSKDHFATVFVVLPSHRHSTFIEAKHGSLKVGIGRAQVARPVSPGEERPVYRPVRLTTPMFISLYTGIETVTLDTTSEIPICFLTYHIEHDATYNTPIPTLNNFITGPREEITRAFAVWAYCLSNGITLSGNPDRYLFYHLDEEYSDDTRASFMMHRKDEAILGHFGPPAKYYGFDMFIAHVNILQTCVWENQKELGKHDIEYRTRDSRMGENGPVETETSWVVAGMDGKPVSNATLVEYIDQHLKNGGWFLNDHLNLDDDSGRTLEVIERSEYTDRLRLTCSKRASFLVISPPRDGPSKAHN